MVSQFEAGKKYVFRRSIFLKDMPVHTKYKWPLDIDGEVVQVEDPCYGTIGIYLIDPCWCEEVTP